MIIFVRTRHIYDSYSDFWKLVELSNFDTCFVDEIDISSENTYIFTPINGEYVHHITAQKNNSNKIWRAKLIWWNLERQIMIDDIPHSDIINEIWVSDRYYATLNSKFKFVILGSHPDLRLNKNSLPKIYDYCHISYITGRRGPLHQELSKRGLRGGPPGWGNERDIVLRSSKVLINIHQDTALIAEPLRFAVCAAYSLPIISEIIQDPYPLINGNDIIMANLNDIINVAVVNYNSNLENMANSLYNKMCIQNTFRSNVEKGLI
jgi:hypothetical protein